MTIASPLIRRSRAQTPSSSAVVSADDQDDSDECDEDDGEAEANTEEAHADRDALSLFATDKKGRHKTSFDDMRQRRIAIHCFCTQIHGALAENTGTWNGKNGMVAKIQKDSKLPIATNHRTIVKCLRLINLHKEKGAPHLGENEPRKEWAHCETPLDSFEAQVIADVIEQSFGFTETTFFVNLQQEEEGKEPVGRSCLCQTVQRMKPVVTVIQKCQQGSTDVNSSWAVASHRWAAQNLIRLGELKSRDLTLDLWDGENIPDCFNDEKLTKINVLCVQEWDETHKQQRVGAAKNGEMIEHRFPRTDHGKLDFGGEG